MSRLARQHLRSSTTRRLLLAFVAAFGSAACGSFASSTAPTEQQAAQVSDSSTPPPTPAPTPTPAPMTARYSVTLDASWSVSTHPSDFPDSAHFSPIVGAVHASDVTFWREGVLATEGIRAMAERGATATLTDEVQQAVAAGTAQRSFVGPRIDQSPGRASLDIEVSQAFPLVTLVTMVAPSPDWFIGVSGLPLFQNGAWRDDVRIDLDPWDAGTDSGVTFRSPDEETVPRAPVFRILTFPFVHQGRVAPLGTLLFERVQ